MCSSSSLTCLPPTLFAKYSIPAHTLRVQYSTVQYGLPNGRGGRRGFLPTSLFSIHGGAMGGPRSEAEGVLTLAHLAHPPLGVILSSTHMDGRWGVGPRSDELYPGGTSPWRDWLGISVYPLTCSRVRQARQRERERDTGTHGWRRP